MRIDRRELMKLGVAAGTAALTPVPAWAQSTPGPLVRSIPSSDVRIPAVGLGSWITFNVGDDPVLLASCADVMEAFFAAGGTVIDSSPMYGSSQATIGYGLEKLNRSDDVFAADKVWTRDSDAGASQLELSRSRWGVPDFDLAQVHNLLAWEPHLETLFAMKQAGSLLHVGVTTSHGRRHGEMEAIMGSQPIDFVQLTYNPVDREAEERLLPLARERGIAVLVNRPFRGGSLADHLAREPLPDWATDIGASSWAQIILKYILANPAVTCAIPATTRIDHVQENVRAASDPLPDEAMRQRIADHIRSV